MDYHYKQNRGVKLTLSKKTILFIIVFVSVLGVIVLMINFYPWPIKTRQYNNVTIQFDVDLREAKNIPVYPNENSTRNLINTPTVKKLTFVIQNTSDFSLTKLEVVQTSATLSYALKIFDPGFFDNILIANSFDNLNSTAENPYIALTPPSISDGTYVKVVKNSVFISGKDRHGFDLATAKFIISSLGIRI